MRIKNINEQDEYPENYDNLNQYEKRDIELPKVKMNVNNILTYIGMFRMF